jgi:hypothetical protein
MPRGSRYEQRGLPRTGYGNEDTLAQAADLSPDRQQDQIAGRRRDERDQSQRRNPGPPITRMLATTAPNNASVAMPEPRSCKQPLRVSRVPGGTTPATACVLKQAVTRMPAAAVISSPTTAPRVVVRYDCTRSEHATTAVQAREADHEASPRTMSRPNPHSRTRRSCDDPVRALAPRSAAPLRRARTGPGMWIPRAALRPGNQLVLTPS